MLNRNCLGWVALSLLALIGTSGCVTGDVGSKSSDANGGVGGKTNAKNGGSTTQLGGARSSGAAGSGTSSVGGATGVTAATGTAAAGTGNVAGGVTDGIGGAATGGGMSSIGTGANFAGAANFGGTNHSNVAGTAAIGGAGVIVTAAGSGAIAPIGGATSVGGGVANGGVPANGGVSTNGGATGGAAIVTTGGVIATGGLNGAATGGVNSTGGAATGGGSVGPGCSDGQKNGDETAVDCGGSCGSACAPNQVCSVPADCAAFICTNNLCGAYATGCRELKTRGAPPGKYFIDADGDDYMEPFLAYCPTVGTNLAPVGICQAEIGAPPACRSFMGAVGFDFKGVDFAGEMKDGGVLDVAGQAIYADREVLPLSDGTYLTTQVNGAVAIHYLDGTSATLGSGYSSPHGIVQLFDKRMLATAANGIFILSRDGSSSAEISTTAAASGSQLVSGEIWIPSITTFKIHRFDSTGHAVGTLDHPAFVSQVSGVGPHSLVGMADGTVVVANSGDSIVGGSNSGRLVFFETDLRQREFSKPLNGMTKFADGSIMPTGLSGVGNLLQLPNGRLLVSSPWDNRIVRFTPSGDCVDSISLGGIPNPYGLSMDHRGRLLAASSADGRVHVITFPGCSDGIKNFTETDIDCGGICTNRCAAGRQCAHSTDCQSGICTSNYCDN